MSCDYVYILDSTGSMSSEICATHKKVIQLAVSMKLKHSSRQFRFACICFRDPVDSRTDCHQVLQFTSNIDDIQKFLLTIRAEGGGDTPEDFVGAFSKLLSLNWHSDSMKAAIIIGDAPPHGKMFCGEINHEDQTALLVDKLEEIIQMGIKLTVLSINGGMNSAHGAFIEKFKKKGGKLKWRAFDEIYGGNNLNDMENAIFKTCLSACNSGDED